MVVLVRLYRFMIYIVPLCVKPRRFNIYQRRFFFFQTSVNSFLFLLALFIMVVLVRLYRFMVYIAPSCVDVSMCTSVGVFKHL